MERDRREYEDGRGMWRGAEPRDRGHCHIGRAVSRRGVVVHVLESGGYRSKLEKFFEVDARSVREGNEAIHNCAERRALFVSERVRDNVRGVEDMAANVRNVVGYGHTSSCSRW